MKKPENEFEFLLRWAVLQGASVSQTEENIVTTARYTGQSYQSVLLACWRNFQHVSAIQTLTFQLFGNDYGVVADEQSKTSPIIGRREK